MARKTENGDMARKTELSEFLRRSRARIPPESAGLPSRGAYRRVPSSRSALSAVRTPAWATYPSASPERRRPPR
ncbi:hypothetical protein [Streptomyces sp. NPDC054783]